MPHFMPYPVTYGEGIMSNIFDTIPFEQVPTASDSRIREGGDMRRAMGKISQFYDKWTNRITTTAALWTLLPAGAIGVLTGWASTSVDWINQLGWFGWVWSGILAFAVTALALAALGRTRLWRAEAKMQERLAGDSSAFDPMASVFEDKRLYLRDLVPPGRKFIVGKTFIRCEIIGPGTIKLMTRSNEQKPWPTMDNNLMHDSDCIEVDPQLTPQNAIFFPDCSFRDCYFFNLTLMFDMRADGVGWNWITPDHRQGILADQSRGESSEQ